MINIQYFLNSLPVMGKGLLGIFLVMAAIYAMISILNYVSAKGSKKDQ